VKLAPQWTVLIPMLRQGNKKKIAAG